MRITNKTQTVLIPGLAVSALACALLATPYSGRAGADNAPSAPAATAAGAATAVNRGVFLRINVMEPGGQFHLAIEDTRQSGEKAWQAEVEVGSGRWTKWLDLSSWFAAAKPGGSAAVNHILKISTSRPAAVAGTGANTPVKSFAIMYELASSPTEKAVVKSAMERSPAPDVILAVPYPLPEKPAGPATPHK